MSAGSSASAEAYVELSGRSGHQRNRLRYANSVGTADNSSAVFYKLENATSATPTLTTAYTPHQSQDSLDFIDGGGSSSAGGAVGNTMGGTSSFPAAMAARRDE